MTIALSSHSFDNWIKDCFEWDTQLVNQILSCDCVISDSNVGSFVDIIYRFVSQYNGVIPSGYEVLFVVIDSRFPYYLVC